MKTVEQRRDAREKLALPERVQGTRWGSWLVRRRKGCWRSALVLGWACSAR
jgi:hypothetical protein